MELTAPRLIGREYNRCHTPLMKTAVSIPDRVFQSAEKLAVRLGISRSELYAKALAALIEKHREELIASNLNEVYGASSEDSSLEPEVSLLQSLSLHGKKR
jgi:hypothetical protein